MTWLLVVTLAIAALLLWRIWMRISTLSAQLAVLTYVCHEIRDKVDELIDQP